MWYSKGIELFFLSFVVTAIATAALFGCATPANVDPQEWRARRVALDIGLAHASVNSLEAKGRISEEKAESLRQILDTAQACMLKTEKCVLGADDPIGTLDLAKKAMAGDPLAQMDLAEKLLARFNERMRQRE